MAARIEYLTRAELIDALRTANAVKNELLFLAHVDDACIEGRGATDIAARVARACVPTLADGVFIDLCERGEFSRRAGAAHASERPELRDAIEAHATSTAWHSYVEHVVMTGLTTLDPSRAVSLAGASAMGFVVVPLASRGKVLGVLAAMRVEAPYSRGELELARKVARRAARAIDGAR